MLESLRKLGTVFEPASELFMFHMLAGKGSIETPLQEAKLFFLWGI